MKIRGIYEQKVRQEDGIPVRCSAAAHNTNSGGKGGTAYAIWNSSFRMDITGTVISGQDAAIEVVTWDVLDMDTPESKYGGMTTLLGAGEMGTIEFNCLDNTVSSDELCLMDSSDLTIEIDVNGAGYQECVPGTPLVVPDVTANEYAEIGTEVKLTRHPILYY